MYRWWITTDSLEKRSTSASSSTVSRAKHTSVCWERTPVAMSDWGNARKTYGCVRRRATNIYGSGSGPLRTVWLCFAIKKVIDGEKPLVRDRTLVFSPRLPFAFVTKIPKNANKNAGDTAGGVRGGMPCRPPCDERSEAQLPTETDFTFLRQFLLEVRTFLAENPQVWFFIEWNADSLRSTIFFLVAISKKWSRTARQEGF